MQRTHKAKVKKARTTEQKMVYERVNEYNAIRSWLYRTLLKSYPEVGTFKTKIVLGMYDFDFVGIDGSKV